MLIAIFLMALLALSLTIAAPKIARSIQRDRDLETFHRGMQYRRAIQLYYRKFKAYPPNVEALIHTNDIRYLRKKYTDPITGQADWKPIAFGQNKTPTAMGFFGQPLAGNASTLAGTGPGGGAGLAGAQGSAFGGPSSGSGSIFGSSDSGNPQSPSAGASSSTENPGATGSTGTTSLGGTSSTGAGSNSSGPTFGGAGIIGFSPASDRTSILVYKKKQHYNEWEFTYDPLSEMKTVGGGNTGLNGQQGTGPTTPATTTFGGPPTNSPNPTPTPPSMPPDTSAPQ